MRNLILIDAPSLPSRHVYGRDIDISRYKHQLGISQDDVYWDATGGLHPNAFAAVAGSIKNEHHFYLYLPEYYLDGDPDHLRMLDYGRPISLSKPHFNQRLRKLLAQPLSYITTEKNHHTAFTLTPQVIVGKRGRGKSTWLAKKIQWLIAQATLKKPTILLVTTFAAHRQQIMSLLADKQHIITLPPDEACRLLPKADYLIIDEAATIPAQQLLTLTDHYQYFSLASSEDGYEGSARFFSLQTLPEIIKKYPNTEVIILHEGHRFTAQDDLERRIEQLFFPSSNSDKVSNDNIHTCQSLSIKTISQQTLIENEYLLGQIYQLLFQGHYKTQPSDLKRLLDLPDQYLVVAFKGQTPIAVAHILIEQPLHTNLARQVVDNIRRPRGRLLMQQLLLHTKQLDYACNPIARIQRIVTHHNHRRQGIASSLVQYALTHLSYQFGVSYGITPQLEAFWQAQGFTTVYCSNTRNARSGRYNAIQLYNN